MNYIKRLEQDNQDLKKELEDVRNQLNELRQYMNSKKFNCGNELDGYINTSDVVNRLPIIFQPH